jgi:hypothetical protein
MKSFALGLAFVAAFGASDARAALQIAAQIGPDGFFCADGGACDTSPASGIITTGNTVLDGIVFSSSSTSAASGGLNFLNASNLLITNTLSTAVDIVITVSATDFTAPVLQFATADAGTWQGSALSTASFKWFVDPANAQGASNAFNTPGALVDSDFSTSSGPVLAFSRTDPVVADALNAPFSMTEQLTLHLGAGESLVNRGQSIVGAAVPEPSTWAMMLVGFVGLAWGALTRKRLRSERAI